MKHPVKPGTRVRFIPHADELIAKGADLSAAKGTVTGTTVPLEGEVLAELKEAERAIRQSMKGDPAARLRFDLEQRPVPGGQLVAILRDDAVPGLRYQFAAPGDLLPAGKE